MFSVVIPLYNKELSVKNTVQSVLNQTIQDFEIIIIDDGSTDDSAKQVKEISDSRIKLIQQKNQGVSAARNRGIEEAKYEWIAFLDSDDIWKPNHLEEIFKMIQMFPDKSVYTTSFEYSDKRKFFKKPRKNLVSIVENYFKEAIDESLMWTGTVVVNNKCLNEVGRFNPILTNGEDLDLWARLANKYQIVKSRNITAIYRIEAENRTSLTRKVKNTHVYHFDLESTRSEDERDYYKYLILNRMYSYSRTGDLSNFLILKSKHKTITFNDYFTFIYYTFRKKINKVLRLN